MSNQMKYLIVGAGITGCVVAEKLSSIGHEVILVDKRNHVGGNCYSYRENDIDYHMYGPHIFHTSRKEVWDYMNQFGAFKAYTNPVLSVYKNEFYQFPINLNTLEQFFNQSFTVDSAIKFIEEERVKIASPKNAEEQCLSLVGEKLYEAFFKEYTEKQWGVQAKHLPASIVKRLPLCFTYQWGYYNDFWQGLPIQGYDAMFKNILASPKIEVLLETDYLEVREKNVDATIYTGPIDAFFDYKYGALGWRSLLWKEKTLPVSNYQGIGVINYPEKRFPFTRSIEYKNFFTANYDTPTKVFFEYPQKHTRDKEPFYPINSMEDQKKLKQYTVLAEAEENVYFAGRLGTYQYLDMDDAVENALFLCRALGAQ